ncbi:MAG TPA: 2-hydroxyacyl-CoA dehydratase family protein [Dehalococcoidia bacterium]|nr:2-hydroxyacyl-CoA dehydratase family protein [Dehalococcoidia bacterium]
MVAPAPAKRFALESTSGVSRLMKNYALRARKAREEQGAKICWHWAVSPPEILRAFNIYPFMVELHSGFLSAKGEITKYLELAEGWGFSRDACTLHRACLGHSLAGEEAMLPNPDLLVCTTSCDSTAKALFPIADHFGVPYFILDLPWNVQASEGPQVQDYRVRYYKGQLEDLITFLEKQTGQRLDEVRLRDSFRQADRLYSAWRDICQLKANVPCPMGGKDEVVATGVLMQLAGDPEGADFMERLRDEVAQRVAHGQGVIEDEQHRILWLGPYIAYDLALFDHFEELGAVVVKAELDHMLSGLYGGKLDPGNPLESFARKQIANLYNGLLENRIEITRRMVGDLKVDGIIYMCAFFCHLLGGSQRAIKDAMSQEFGVPTLVVDVDNVDPRSYNPDIVRSRIEDFLEMLG